MKDKLGRVVVSSGDGIVSVNKKVLKEQADLEEEQKAATWL